jgi:hypothetical protein
MMIHRAEGEIGWIFKSMKTIEPEARLDGSMMMMIVDDFCLIQL